MSRLELQQTLKGHTGRVWCVSWHPLGTALATCGEDKTIRIWGIDGDKWVIKTILTDSHTRTIREVAWSPCGNYIASASFDATTSIWDKKSGEFECSATLEGHENEVKSVAWSPDGHLLATCSRDKSVWVWEIASSIEDEFECAAVLNAHTQDVKKVIWHPTSEILASCSYDNTVKVFREDQSDNDWICTATLESHMSTVWSLAFNKTGDRLVTCSADETIKFWQVYKPGNNQGVATPDNENVWKCVCTLGGYHTRAIYDVDWCKTSDFIVTACGDDMIRIFKEDDISDIHAPTFNLVLFENRAHDEDVNSVKWNPKNIGMLASCSDDGTIKIWKFSHSDVLGDK